MRKKITENMLDALRKEIAEKLSPKRAYHTLCVESMVQKLCDLYCPEETMTLRAAALLHDLTKEKSTEEQEALCHELGLPVTAQSHLSSKTYHAMTAAALIARDYSDYADDVLISAVRWHTTGHKGMTMPEKLLYLADYIDASRTYESCVALRNELFDEKPETLAGNERLSLLRRVLIHSFVFTIEDLIANGKLVANETIEAYNELLLEEMTNSTERNPK